MAAASRVFDVLETQNDVVDKPDALPLKASSCEVVFDNVSFAYGPEEPLALKNINLKAAPGETLALVGMSGGGKTSLVNLIPRLYDVAEGGVFVGGHDVRELTIASSSGPYFHCDTGTYFIQRDRTGQYPVWKDGCR